MSDFRLSRRQVLMATGALAATPPRLLLADSPAQRVVRTRTECVDRPMGLEVTQPRFSWALESASQGVRQTAYRVVVASSSEALLSTRPDLWDSGRVESDRCFDVSYQGHALPSGQRAWWRVEVWTNRDSAPAVAEATWFEMGLLQPGDWLAQWLAIEGAEEKADRAAGLHWIWGDVALDSKPQKFRFRCTLAAKPARAELLLAAKDNLKGVWVNGKAVTLPPSGQVFWGTMLRLPVDLVSGANVVCVAATANTEGFFPPDGGAVAALLKVTGADGQVSRFTSGPDWLTANDEAGDEWTRPDFDDHAWSNAVPSAAHTQCEPWLPHPAMLVRHDFTLSKPVLRARLYATALGLTSHGSTARESGMLTSSPRKSPLPPIMFSTSATMRPACWFKAVMSSARWSATAGMRRVLPGRTSATPFGSGPRRFLAQLVVDYGDGSRDLIGTGPLWRTAESAVRSSEIYNGEDYDARAEARG